MGFYSYGISLYAKHCDNHEQKKAEVLEGYPFLGESIVYSDGDIELPADEFTHNGFTYRVVPDEEYIDYCAGKSFMIIGYNDETREIAYHYFYDFDLDLIAGSGEDPVTEMQRFMDQYFHQFD